jgi:hypothetical protein
MRNCLVIFSSFILFACNNQQKDKTDANKKDSTSTTLQQNEPVLGTPVFKLLSFDKNEHFYEDSIKGTVVEGLSWRDAVSEHRVLFTSIPVLLNKNGQQSSAIYAYCFVQSGGAWQKEWEVKDRIDACEVDATCEFLPGSFTVTDNDNNNIGEVCFLYKLSCKGDVSPDEKKLIMYEGANKYAIRGSTIIEYNGGKEGGDKKIDASFTKAARPLLDFANSQWDKFGTTKY